MHRVRVVTIAVVRGLREASLVSDGCPARPMRWVELAWFEVSFLGARELATDDPLDLEDRPSAPLERLLSEYDAQCVRSNAIVAASKLDDLEAWAPAGLELVSLRWIVTHLIEETARHLGHLDALRELIDGTTSY